LELLFNDLLCADGKIFPYINIHRAQNTAVYIGALFVMRLMFAEN